MTTVILSVKRTLAGVSSRFAWAAAILFGPSAGCSGIFPIDVHLFSGMLQWIVTSSVDLSLERFNGTLRLIFTFTKVSGVQSSDPDLMCDLRFVVGIMSFSCACMYCICNCQHPAPESSADQMLKRYAFVSEGLSLNVVGHS